MISKPKQLGGDGKGGFGICGHVRIEMRAEPSLSGDKIVGLGKITP